MTRLVTIPTVGNRLNELQRLLAELLAQKREFDYSLPIYVFDDSSDSSSISVLQDFQGLLDIHLVGHREREELVDDITRKLALDRHIIEMIFSRSYGGNRNRILAMHPEDEVISIDDDIIPKHLDINPGSEKKYYPKLDELQQERYNFLEAMIRFLGCSTIESRLPVNFSKGEHQKDYVIKDEKIIKCFPLVAYNNVGFEEFAPQEHPCPFVFRELKPCISIGYKAPHGAIVHDNSFVSHIPFVPTTLPYEDLLHSVLVDHQQLGASVMIGKSVIHKMGSRENINYDQFQLIGASADVSGAVIGAVFIKEKDTEGVVSHLRGISKGKLEKYVEQRLEILKYRGQDYPESDGFRTEVTRKVAPELLKATWTFEYWKRIIDYKKNNV